jgi:hypothetical protein
MIGYAASFIEWFAEEENAFMAIIPGHQADKRLIVIKQPIGVTAAITPWNFSGDDHRKAGPALAGLHNGTQTRQPDPFFRAGAGRTGQTRRISLRI